MLAIVKQVLVLAIYALTGCVLAKKKVVKTEHSSILSALAVYVFLPCTAFNTFCTNFTVDYLTQKYPLILVSAVLLLVIMVVGKTLAKKLQPTGYDRAVYEYSLIISNASYIGCPLILSLRGSLALLDLMVFMIPLFIYTYTLAYDLLTEQTGKPFSIKRLMTPVMIAMLLGCMAGLTGIQLPDVITQVTESASACLGSVAMLLLGISLAELQFKDLLSHRQVYIVTAMRLVIIPVAVALMLKLLKQNDILLPAVFYYAMPCGLNVIIFPKMVGHDCTRGAALVLISTVLSLVTIPLCIYFLC